MPAKQVAAVLVLATAASAAGLQANTEGAFERFQASHQRTYMHAGERAMRKRVFEENMRAAAEMQAANPHATFGANKFADMTAAEFGAYHSANAHFERAQALRSAAGPVADVYAAHQLTADGQKVDWREKGAVTEVKDQGNCGSCWAFSAVGNIEGQWFLANHTLTRLSEQELVACDTVDGGCDGGLMDDAFAWIIKNRNGWISTEQSYPYASGAGMSPSCKRDGLEHGAQISSYKMLPASESQIAQWMLTHGTVSVGLDATSFQFYTSGIMTNCISRQLNHGVLAVGFDSTNVPPYWIVKNSWGTNWGEGGYIRVAMGSNQCLIANYATTAFV